MKHKSMGAPGAKDETIEWRIVRRLLPYLWPVGRFDLKARVVIACVFVLVAKLTTVYVPLFYKQAVDALDGLSTFLDQAANALEQTDTELANSIKA